MKCFPLFCFAREVSCSHVRGLAAALPAPPPLSLSLLFLVSLRSVHQVRSHAQKWEIKMAKEQRAKSGTEPLSPNGSPSPSPTPPTAPPMVGKAAPGAPPSLGTSHPGSMNPGVSTSKPSKSGSSSKCASWVVLFFSLFFFFRRGKGRREKKKKGTKENEHRRNLASLLLVCPP